MKTPVEAFCDEHFAYHGISDDRQRMVRRVLADLAHDAGKPAELVGHEEFRSFLAGQLAGGLHVNTVRKHANALRPFFEWGWRKGLIDDGRYLRLRDVENPRGSTGRSTPRPYSRKELDAFWRALDARWPLDREEHWVRRFERGLSRYRRVWPLATRRQLDAMVRLALDCGMRRDEVFRAQLDDIHPDNAYVVVRGARKGTGDREARIREVPYTEAARAAMAEWLQMRTVVMGAFGEAHESVWLALHPSASPNNPMLPSSPAAPMRHRAFKSQLATVGGYELHRFRHTCATERLRSGMKLENLQRFLGHGSLQQTLAYAEIVRDDIHRDALRTESAFAEAVGQRAA